MMAIDIANPQEDAAALREALLTSIAPEGLIIESEGNWKTSFQTFAVAPGVMSFFPSNVSVSAQGCWLQDFYFEEDTDDGLTSLSFPNLAGVIQDLQFRHFEELLVLSLPELAVVGSECEFYDLEKCTSIDIPSLRAVGEVLNLAYCGELETFTAQSLEFSDELDFYSNESLVSVSFPALETVGDIYFYDLSSLSDLSFPALKNIRWYFEISYCESLAAIHFDVLERIGYVGLNNGCESITSWRYGSSLIEARSDQNFSDCTLDRESVDHILTTLAGLDGNDGTVEYESRSIYIQNDNSAPSYDGWSAVQTLIERDCYVEFNRSWTFNMTAGVSGSEVGYIADSPLVGVIDEEPIDASIQLMAITVNIVDDSLTLYFGSFDENHISIFDGLSLRVNDTEYPGYWSITENGIEYTLSEPETAPVFVDEQSYLIEIR